MKEWWQTLSLRDKQLVSLAGFSLMLVLLYLSAWHPLNQRVETLRMQIERNAELLDWMQTTDQQIKTLKTTRQNKQNLPNRSLLSLLQNNAKSGLLAKSPFQLKQAENDAVQLSFQKVEFDALIAWLISIGQEYNLVVSQIAITPIETPGVVATNLLLKLA